MSAAEDNDIEVGDVVTVAFSVDGQEHIPAILDKDNPSVFYAGQDGESGDSRWLVGR